LRQLCKSKVQNFRLSSVNEKYVWRLDVAVNEAFCVCSFQSVSNLYSDVHDLRYRDRPARDAVLQRLAFQQLHGDKRAAFKLSDVVDCADVWVIQRGGGTCFATKSLDCLSILGNIVRQELQGDIAPQSRVFRFIDDAHSSAA
jgi:hypothetical protein